MNTGITNKRWVLFYGLISAFFLITLPVQANFSSSRVQVAAERPAAYLPLLTGKRLGLVVNASSRVADQHLVDFLLAQGQQVSVIFAPEHGFRGTADAGAHISNSKDTQTGLPVVSLYGANKQPSPEQLQEIDLLIFDVQDVGVRYYTYISTLHYLMEAAAETGVPLLVLDRPNPNGAYIDGPTLEPEYRSFVGMHAIPLLHGLTVAELARMIVGEGWLQSKKPLDLTVIPVNNYTHQTAYSLPVRPSPNLPNDQAIALYPSLGLFEGTIVSVGRGTPTPFQVIGLPSPDAGLFSFLPLSRPGASAPPYQGQVCYGYDLRSRSAQGLNLSYLLEMYQHHPSGDFFNPFFQKLAGTRQLQEQIRSGWSEAQIRESWQADLLAYQHMRKAYLLYPD